MNEEKESTMIYPAEETPKGSLWLSSLDLIIRSPYTQTNAVFVYEQNNEQTSDPKATPIFDTNLVKQALSKALVEFYPMAGRLKTNPETGRIEIDCNAEGALFIESETTHVLADFGDFKPSPELRKVVFPECNFDGGLSSFPLLLVQLTRFKCGGVTLGFGQHHHVADGASHLHFINSWAKITKGVELDVLPFHDRYSCFKPRDPPLIEFQHLEYEPPLPPLPPPKSLSGEATTTVVASLFKFSKEQINTIKEQATSHDYRPSTFEALAGHAWRTVCRARGLRDDQDVKLYMPSDGRSRFKHPALPQGYCGNVIFFTACVAKAGNLMQKPLWYSAQKVHQALNRVKNEDYLRSAIDYLESQPDLTALVRGPHSTTSPNFMLNSWVNLPYKNSDFGWGEPKYLRIGGVRYEGQSFLMANQHGDGTVSLAVNLFTLHMPLFQKYLYDFSACH